MSDIDLAGGCQCGTVRYRVTAAATRTFHCHCSMCRKLHGAVFVTFSTVPEDGFAIERGEESLGRFESSAADAPLVLHRLRLPALFPTGIPQMAPPNRRKK